MNQIIICYNQINQFMMIIFKLIVLKISTMIIYHQGFILLTTKLIFLTMKVHPQNIELPNQLNQNIPNEAKTTIPTTQMNINPEIRLKKTTSIFRIKKEKKIGRRKRKKQDIINLKRKMFWLKLKKGNAIVSWDFLIKT